MNPISWENPILTVLRVVAFDLDDTLYPERSFVLSGFQAVAQWAQTEWGISATDTYRALEADFLAGVRGNTFNRWLDSHQISGKEALSSLLEIYRSHQPNLELYPDVLPALDMLQNQYSLALITEGYRGVQERKIQALGVRDRFEFVHVGGEDERENWKPSPYPFQRLCAHFSIRPEQGVYVGDNPAKDFHGARALGLMTIRMRREDGLHAEAAPPEESYSADMTIQTMADLESAILTEGI
jgi:putative hydrolase of the HAD superfamily